MLFTKTQEFRELATDKDYDELKKYYLKTKSEDWKNNDCPYGFSRSSAFNLLTEKGLLQNTYRQAYTDTLDINQNKLQTTQHTIYVTDDVWERLNCIYKNHAAIDKKNVLDAFLRKALDDMGI